MTESVSTVVLDDSDLEVMREFWCDGHDNSVAQLIRRLDASESQLAEAERERDETSAAYMHNVARFVALQEDRDHWRGSADHNWESAQTWKRAHDAKESQLAEAREALRLIHGLAGNRHNSSTRDWHEALSDISRIAATDGAEG